MEGAKNGFCYSDMRLQIQNGRSGAFGLLEVLVVVVCLLVVAAMLLPMLARSKRRSNKINCESNLMQVNLAFRIWEGDNNNEYPMGVSVTNGGAMELMETGNASAVFRVTSNELSTTKILVCPMDSSRTYASNWDDLNGSHISYFISANVTNEEYPQMVLDGDDNLLIAGNPVKSGVLEVSSNSTIAWSGKRHGYVGNLGFADGSVAEESQGGMQQAFQGIGLATNRIAIP